MTKPGKLLDKWCECTYCGAPANGVDHIVPISYNGYKLKGKNGKRGNQSYDKKKTVPVCNDCNNLLNDYAIFSIHERAAYISQRLAIKHRKLLSTPDWSEDELSELDMTLRSKVVREQTRKTIINNRISWSSVIASMEFITTDMVWSAVHLGQSLMRFLGYEID